MKTQWSGKNSKRLMKNKNVSKWMICDGSFPENFLLKLYKDSVNDEKSL